MVALVLGTIAFCIPGLRRRPLTAVGLTATTTLWVAMACGSGPIFAWIHTDPLGTPLVATSTTNLPAPPAVIWRATYEPFGRATVNQDPDGDGVVMLQNVRFPGQYFDFESGLHYNYFRTYDPATGRYLEADPIGLVGGLNPYAYASSDGINRSDTLGLADSVSSACSAGRPSACAALFGDLPPPPLAARTRDHSA